MNKQITLIIGILILVTGLIILNKNSQNDLCKLLEIIFRIKDKYSKDFRYFVPFDILYHKLK